MLSHIYKITTCLLLSHSIIYAQNFPSGGYQGGTYGCTGASNLQPPGGIIISCDIGNANCYGEADGFLDITVSGGATPYSFVWSTGATTEDIYNLPAGTYSVTVSDQAGITTAGYYISEPPPVSAFEISTNPSCYGGSDGAIDIFVSGGASPYVYYWSNGETTEDISNLFSGTYWVIIADANNCYFTGNIITIISPPEIQLSGVVTSPVAIGGSNGSIDLSVSGGTPPYVYSWSNGATSEDITGLTAGIYYAYVTDVMGCSGYSLYTVNDGYLNLPPWSYYNTGSNHSLLVPASAPMTINGNPVQPGDYVGVFYELNDSLYCSGFIIWQGITTGLIAYGDNMLTTIKDGFISGEIFKWKIWDVSSGTEYIATATYNTAQFPDSCFYTENGLSGIIALEGYDQQIINLLSGWYIFSTYIVPVQPGIADVVADIVSDVIIIKDGEGKMYWPQWGVNLIGDMVIGQGYQSKMLNPQILTVSGQKVIPDQTPVPAPQGWSILGYLRDTSGDIIIMLSSIYNNIILVKDWQGNVYWPAYGINLIGDMIPGRGYQFALSSSGILVYPTDIITVTVPD